MYTPWIKNVIQISLQIQCILFERIINTNTIFNVHTVYWLCVFSSIWSMAMHILIPTFPAYQSCKTHLIWWPYVWKTIQAHYWKATNVKASSVDYEINITAPEDHCGIHDSGRNIKEVENNQASSYWIYISRLPARLVLL